MPKVSIIIPVFNAAEHIVDTLNSVFEQSYKDYEVIVINDGSTDSTENCLNQFAHKIRYFYQANKGAPAARNKGLLKSEGEFISFLDSDDIWLRDNLKIKVSLLSQHTNIAGLFSNFHIFKGSDTIAENGIKYLYPFFKKSRKNFKHIFSDSYQIKSNSSEKSAFYFGNIFQDLFIGNFILTSTTLFRKEFLDKIDNFDQTLVTQQDYDYFLRIAKNFPLGYIDETLVLYRRHKQQLTNHSNIERIMNNVLLITSRYEKYFYYEQQSYFYNKRKAEIIVNLAKVYISTDRSRLARKILINNLYLSPFLLSTYIHLTLSFFPQFFINFLRKVF